eukprot:TRINITY_DN1130_c0_g1_i3.p1 TRINITY_DN1130_c0_g1~~TRINITY_DN1130_c0_g1_i3.p1  ORF type:complete len:326 (-),score=71.81 TRINITY_DN1130_c0_g1_i3:169-1044(-)
MGTVWKKLMGPGIILGDEATNRILRDCVRYVFFSDMLTFFTSLSAANTANADARKKAEAEKRMAEKKAANEKARAEKKEKQKSEVEKMEGIDVLDSVKASLAEEKIVEETRNIATGQMVWKRMALRQKIASAVKADFTITPESRKSLSADYLRDLKEAFDIFDKESSGSITSSNLGDILRSLGQNPTDDEVNKMVAKIDQDGNGTIDFDEFSDFMASAETASTSSLDSAFKAIDENGNGKLDIGELKDVLTKLGEKPNDKQLESMMYAAGQSPEGEIDFDKFVKLMNCDFS